ncbi:unnamed protein product [Ectocarpus sp. CCAP 1310/34]|nr:unnamed protein product [Ectocarpus sp. CCAP 1310/34]
MLVGPATFLEGTLPHPGFTTVSTSRAPTTESTIYIQVRYTNHFFSVCRQPLCTIRSPILACTSGLGITVRYVVTTYAVILTALRLFVMYYPNTRAKYGRVTREKPWACGLAATYLLGETVVRLAAAVQGTKRVATVMTNLDPVSVFITITAVVCLGRQLKRIHDLRNMGRMFAWVGSLAHVRMLGAVFTAIQVLPLSALAFKYFSIVFMTLSHPAIVWIL